MLPDMVDCPIELPQYYPTTCNASGVNELNDKCARLWFYKNRLRQFPRIYDTSEALEIGNVVHDILASLYLGKSWDTAVDMANVGFSDTMEKLEASLPYDFSGEVEKLLNDVAKAWAVGVSMANLFWTKFPLPDTYKVIATEQYVEHPIPLTYWPPLLPLAGVLDLVIENTEDGNIWVSDHKTCSAKPANIIIGKKWALQTRWYWPLAMELTGKSPIGFIYNLMRKPTIRQRTKRNPETLEEYMVRVEEDYEAKPDIEVCESFPIRFSGIRIAPDLLNHVVNYTCNATKTLKFTNQWTLDCYFPRVAQPTWGMNKGCSGCKWNSLCQNDIAVWPKLFSTIFDYAEPHAEAVKIAHTQEEEDATDNPES